MTLLVFFWVLVSKFTLRSELKVTVNSKYDEPILDQTIQELFEPDQILVPELD
jgi:hypothetical protein